MEILESLTLVEGLQLFANLGALIGGFSVWKLYIGNLKAALTSKDAEISTLKTIRDDLKEKAEALERRSPEFMERVLAERIDHREKEITRFLADKEVNGEKVQLLEQEKALLESTLEKTQSLTRGFVKVLSLEQEELGSLDLEDVDELEVVKLGDVGVDSGQLLITDPLYIKEEWSPAGQEGVGIIEDPELSPYSYEGACKATAGSGYGELAYRLGHKGAGVVFATAFGDGLYPIYGEKHDGRIVRVYVNVA